MLGILGIAGIAGIFGMDDIADAFCKFCIIVIMDCQTCGFIICFIHSGCAAPAAEVCSDLLMKLPDF
jgi:hypothetical protein